VRVLGDRRFLESVVKTFAFRDLERDTKTIVVGAKAHQSANDRLVRSVTLAGPCEGTVQLDLCAMRSSPDKAAGK
jgi:hypothetical protein